MADKTTTLKTKTNDNVYPNVIGDNRKNAFVDSSTITHHFYNKTHKVGFQIANETNIKIQNSLQKPAGLTKTKLVGVGTNGQENIEIGDNLTLANGKLSAMIGGSSEVNIIEGTVTSATDGIINFTVNKDIDLNKVNILSIDENYIIINRTYTNIHGNCGYFNYIGHENSLITGSISGRNGVSLISYDWFSPYFYHFITMTNSTDNVALYLTIQNISEDTFTSDTLASYLANNKVLANGNLHGVVPIYIAGEGGVIKIYYRTPGDSNINPTPDEYQDLSSFTITDLVTPVE